MQVRILPIAQQRKESWVGKCEEHLVADGEIIRSKKTDGVVERKRKCDKCGALFKTYEYTGDQCKKQGEEFDNKVRELKEELVFYSRIHEMLRQVTEIQQGLEDEVRMGYNFGGRKKE
ncbi:hypothetical protein ES705_39341 [subsurface metagenome]